MSTVRAWFRQMRAADFARDVQFVSATVGPYFFSVRKELLPWTLFDTQQVVDRETAAHYRTPAPDIGSIFFVQGDRVVGRIDNVLLKHPPHAGPIDSLHGTPDALPSHRVDYLGIDRSSYPAYTANVVPTSSKGITLDDVRRYVREDDASRSERAPKAWSVTRRCAEMIRALPRTCSKCAGPVRLSGAPMGYVGPCSGSLLYHYAKLLEPDNRYLSPKPEIWMCDACQLAGVL